MWLQVWVNQNIIKTPQHPHSLKQGKPDRGLHIFVSALLQALVKFQKSIWMCRIGPGIVQIWRIPVPHGKHFSLFAVAVILPAGSPFVPPDSLTVLFHRRGSHGRILPVQGILRKLHQQIGNRLFTAGIILLQPFTINIHTAGQICRILKFNSSFIIFKSG